MKSARRISASRDRLPVSSHALKSKLAIITGASSGIGRDVAHMLAARGYATLLIARRAAELESLARELSRHAPSTALPLDLANCEEIEPALQRALAGGPAPAVLVNAAGYGIYRSFLDHSHFDMTRLMRVNFDAAACAIRAVLPGMVEARAGHIINVSSMSARIGPWGHAGYAAAKSAMRSLTETLAAEYRPQGVRFTVIYPGIVRTPYFEMPTMAPLWERVRQRAVPSEKVARAIVDAIGRDRLYIYIPRHYRAIDLIAAIAPRFAHRLVRSGSMAHRAAPMVAISRATDHRLL